MLGEVFLFFSDVVRIYVSFLFLLFLDTLSFVHRSCNHLVIANIVFIIDIYIWWCCYHISPISPCVVSFLSLYIHFLFILYNLLFLIHTKMLWLVLFKVFQKYRLSKSIMLWTLFLQSFQELVLGLDFIVFNKWLWVEWFMTFFIFHLFVVVLLRIVKGGDC